MKDNWLIERLDAKDVFTTDSYVKSKYHYKDAALYIQQEIYKKFMHGDVRNRYTIQISDSSIEVNPFLQSIGANTPNPHRIQKGTNRGAITVIQNFKKGLLDAGVQIFFDDYANPSVICVLPAEWIEKELVTLGHKYGIPIDFSMIGTSDLSVFDTYIKEWSNGYSQNMDSVFDLNKDNIKLFKNFVDKQHKEITAKIEQISASKIAALEVTLNEKEKELQAVSATLTQTEALLEEYKEKYKKASEDKARRHSAEEDIISLKKELIATKEELAKLKGLVSEAFNGRDLTEGFLKERRYLREQCENIILYLLRNNHI